VPRSGEGQTAPALGGGGTRKPPAGAYAELHCLSKAGARIPSRINGRAYAELHCRSNFSFLRGASHPEELVAQAAELGYAALAIADRNSLAGVVRAHLAAKEHNLHLLIGAEITPIDASPLVLLAPDRAAYGRLCRLITRSRRRTPKGRCAIYLQDIAELAPGLIAIALAQGVGASSCHSEEAQRPRNLATSARASQIPRSARNDRPTTPPLRPSVPSSLRPFHTYRDIFGNSLFLAAELAYDVPDAVRLEQLAELSRQTGIPLVAANDVHYHVPRRRYLQDVLTCIREKCTLAAAGRRLFANAERHLRPPAEIIRRYAACPEAIERALQIAARCTFSLDELCYEYPHELCPRDTTPVEYLAKLTWTGARERYPDGIPESVCNLAQRELELIAELKYEHYFLTVWDLVRFARRRGILCQGRGSAANSAVCYCLGITAVDPARIDLLFERFISHERNEPPDIDVDFEHERREEVFQYIYGKYGRERAGITAEVITYRPRSAVRDVGKALGLSLDRVDTLAKALEWWSDEAVPDEAIRAAGLDPRDRTVQMLVRLVRQLLGFPRHLSQHVGGFVITETPLCEIVPLENGAMPGRTFIEWDKDDIDALGILKVDCLALGMLTAINKCFALLQGLRDSGIKGLRKETSPGGKADVSRSEGVAEIDRAGQAGLRDYQTDAGLRAVRFDEPNAPGGGVDSKQYCGGQRPAEPEGLYSLPHHGARLTGGVGNTTHRRPGTELPPSFRRHAGENARDFTDASRADHEPATEREGLRDLGIQGFRSTNNGGRRARAVCAAPQSLNPLIPQSLPDLPPEDPAVYDMICAADTVGVFQIESRAQMSMLPRLKPRCFYDLVVEVAIVRPGPIQGGMIHPYLRRRNGLEPVIYPSEEVKKVLEKTLGVPLFQEQVMRLAVVAAGFTPGEADQLRRAMAAWRRSGQIEKFQLKLMKGMLANGLSRQFAEQIYKQIRGFGEYGFPESHAASFALLVYASAWLKRYHPAAFCAALLNSQPLGFYTPGQLIRDAIAHGVPVLPVDVNCSGYDCTLEGDRDLGIKGLRDSGDDQGHRTTATRLGDSSLIPQSLNPSIPAAQWGRASPCVRLGMRLVRGLSEEKVRGIIAARREAGQSAGVPFSIPQSLNPSIPLPITSIRQLARRGDVSRETLVRLAAADAFRSLGLNRRQALWHILALDDAEPPLFAELEPDEPAVELPAMSLDETVVQDYDALGFSLNAHPLGLVRQELDVLELRHEGRSVRRADRLVSVVPAERLRHMRNGAPVAVAGLVTVRQRPGTAKGMVFMTLEDETGMANLVIRPNVWERERRVARKKIALIAEGHVERQGEVIHVMVRRLHDLSARLANLTHRSRDFH